MEHARLGMLKAGRRSAAIADPRATASGATRRISSAICEKDSGKGAVLRTIQERGN